MPRTQLLWPAPSAAEPPNGAGGGTRPQARRRQSRTSSSASFFLRFFGEVCNAIALIVRQPGPFASEHGCDNLLRRSVEERVDEMAQRRLAGGASGDGRHVDVADPSLFMGDMPLLFQ